MDRGWGARFFRPTRRSGEPDFTESPAPIDDEYPYVFVVRDLGSGATLMALPVPSQEGRVVRDALAALFRRHGPPLVLKCDNGPGFIAGETRAFLAAHDVIPLLSPAYTPRFNGSCEAGIGGLKTRAHHEAAVHGRPGEWTCDDVENARLRGNANARPRGASGPSPSELWERRSQVIDRSRLRREVETATKEVHAGLLTTLDVDCLDARHRAAVERIAIGRALVQCGHCSYGGGDFLPPLPRPDDGSFRREHKTRRPIVGTARLVSQAAMNLGLLRRFLRARAPDNRSLSGS